MTFNSADLAFGAYTATWNSNALGLLEGPVRHHEVNHAQDVRCSRGGDAVVDGVFRGKDVWVQIILKEWDAYTKAAINPFDTDMGETGVIGRSMEAMAQALVLTAVTGTPAATEGPATRTYAKSILSPEHNVEVLMGNVERNVPLVFKIYPQAEGANPSTHRHFTDT